MNLIAIWRSVNVFVADQTSAMPPVPSSWFSRSFPTTIFPDSIPFSPRASRSASLTRSRDRHTSVDHKGVSGQETGSVGGEVERASGDLVRRPITLHRGQLQDLVEEDVVLQDRRRE